MKIFFLLEFLFFLLSQFLSTASKEKKIHNELF